MCTVIRYYSINTYNYYDHVGRILTFNGKQKQLNYSANV